jgi:hypothetical protein
MKAFVISALLVCLIGCRSIPPGPPLPSVSERQLQLKDAAARAEAAGDFRPYPIGWPEGTLPLHAEPEIVQSIQLGETMPEVARVMGREGWSHTTGRNDFLKELYKSYGKHGSSYKLPNDLKGMKERLPEKGRFMQWEYQGFPSTADWIVIFFAPSVESPDSEPCVVARGVFRLGDW